MTDGSTSELSARLAVLEERLAELEAHKEPEPEGFEALDMLLTRVFSAEARQHMRAARKEQLKAARAVLDHWIDRMERAPRERVRRRESIKLE